MSDLRQRSVETLARVLWEFHRTTRELQPAEAIIGLGSYDLRVAQWCADLWKQRWAPVLLFSGAHGNWTRGRWSKSEAEVFADEAVRAGVPRERILLETKATNIGENLRLSRALLESQGIAVKRVIVVTKPQTLRRVVATAPVFWAETELVTSCPAHDLPAQPTPEHSWDDLVNEMVGDVQRMLDYPGLGFQVPQEVSPEVLAAYEELQARGYTRHLTKNR